MIPNGVRYWELDGRQSGEEGTGTGGRRYLTGFSMRSSLEERIDHYDTIREDICYEMFLCLTLFFIILDGKACSFGGVPVRTIWCALHLASHCAAIATPSTYLLYIPYTQSITILNGYWT